MEQQKRDSWKPQRRSRGERRIAPDGREYSERDFHLWYGEEKGRRYWQTATATGAPQPGGANRPQSAGAGAARPRHGWGTNSTAVRAGKHSRFARHMQLEAGSRKLAELIIFTGCFDVEFFMQEQKRQGSDGASQPSASEPAVKSSLKRAAETAILDYRKTVILRNRLLNGLVDEFDLDVWQLRNLLMLENGCLLNRTTEAVAAYSHDSVRAVRGAP